MARSKLVETNEKLAEGVTAGYKKIEEGVTGSYKKLEEGVVGAYKKIEDQFVDRFLAREGETTEGAKARLMEERRERRKEGLRR